MRMLPDLVTPTKTHRREGKGNKQCAWTNGSPVEQKRHFRLNVMEHVWGKAGNLRFHTVGTSRFQRWRLLSTEPPGSTRLGRRIRGFNLRLFDCQTHLFVRKRQGSAIELTGAPPFPLSHMRGWTHPPTGCRMNALGAESTKQAGSRVVDQAFQKDCLQKVPPRA